MVCFSVIRTEEDIDSNFDFTKSPLEPVTVGIVENNAGLGHKVEIVNNGDPKGPEQWMEQRKDPEPNIGAGHVEYYIGNTSWPVVTTYWSWSRSNSSNLCCRGTSSSIIQQHSWC